MSTGADNSENQVCPKRLKLFSIRHDTYLNLHFEFRVPPPYTQTHTYSLKFETTLK